MATTPPSIYSQPQSQYEPDDAQLKRAAALHRFNWLYVYTPLGIGALLLLGLTVLILWGIFSPQVEANTTFLSGLADLIIIFFLLPVILLCSIGPIGLGGIIAYTIRRRREQKASPFPPAKGNRLQRLLWQADHMLGRVQVEMEKTLPKVVNPVIQLNASLSYLAEMLAQIRRALTRQRK